MELNFSKLMHGTPSTQNTNLNQAPHCGSEISVNVFVFNTRVCILYPACQIRILGSGNPVFVYSQAPWLIQSLSQGGEVLFQRHISLRWSGVSRSLIWESRDQELSHDPSTKGAQKKEGGLRQPGKIRGTFTKEVTVDLDLEE